MKRDLSQEAALNEIFYVLEMPTVVTGMETALSLLDWNGLLYFANFMKVRSNHSSDPSLSTR